MPEIIIADTSCLILLHKIQEFDSSDHGIQTAHETTNR
jgi:hypothetical protein